MRAGEDRTVLRLKPEHIGSFCIAFAAAVLVADALLQANVVVPLAYVVPIALSVWTRSRAVLWTLTAVALAATWGMHFWGPQPLEATGATLSLLNRGLVSAVLALQALHIHGRIAIEQARVGNETLLQQQAAEVEEVNEELLQREEEIVRQNEELQSQTEELERQTEELRVTNEELAARERSLEQLLELSRSLTADLTRGQIMEKVCEAIGVLTDGAAAAILERRGNEVVISCHHGFGPGGPQGDRLPLADSFASIILSMGATGYLEDVNLRPELVIPMPKEGEPFRAVLSAPLRMQGKAVGMVELYSPQPRSWDAAQVTIVESLAAQLAISLQNIDLVEAIRQERRRFEAAFRTVPFGLAVTDDPEGTTVQLNPAASTMLGIPLGENVAVGTAAGARLRRSVTRNRVPVDPSDLPLARALRGEEVMADELEFAVAKDALSLLCCAAPILDGQGSVVGAVSAFADITELKSVQRELEIRRREAEEASVRKTRFLAAVSHDIRTPANAINLMAELIRRASVTPQLAQEMPDLAERLQANTRSLMELVSDVLDVARFDSGKIELIESEFSLADLIADECRQVRPLADDKGIQLVMEPMERPIWLHTDRVKLGRVLGNLLGNAVKFTAKGTVRVSAGFRSSNDRSVVVRVEDTGIGIADESLPRIFDEFAQLHNPERDRSKGTGLGLTICKRLVEVMGGEITVESTINSGSSFQVVLPPSCVALRLDATSGSAKLEPTKPARLPDNPGERLNLSVLIVEDHTSSRDGTARLLRQEGARIIEAKNGREALDALSRCAPDVVLLDMMLPDMDGREVLRRLQAQPPPGLKGVLVLTGDLTAERLAEVKQYGADALIGKPVDVSKLIEALADYQTTRGGQGGNPDGMAMG
jgi:CheY-like chemotaxis protein